MKGKRASAGTSDSKTIIFDFDGTLANTLSISHRVLNELSLKYKFRWVSEEELAQLKELPARQVLNSLGIPWYKVPFVISEGKKRVQKQISEIRLQDSYMQIIREIKAKCKMGIVTSNSKKNVELFLHNNQLSDFDFIHGDSKIFGKDKALKRVIKNHKLSLNNTLLIGDEVRDILAARKVGIAVASVAWGYNTVEALKSHSPNYFAQTLDEMKQIIHHFIKEPKESEPYQKRTNH